MRLIRLLFAGEMRAPVSVLAASSAIGIGIVGARVMSTWNIVYAFLVWNLFLAWLPLVFALLARETYRKDDQRRWRWIGLGIAWLLFFPNAPYILTDLVHLKTAYYTRFWTDLVVILLFALTGLVLGFLSLYAMQSIVTDRFGKTAGWSFVALAAGLAGVGVGIGRFFRLNSWDILRPGVFYERMDAWVGMSWGHLTLCLFMLLFSISLLVGYLMFYALTRLPQDFRIPEKHG